ncbi:hypothetical protein T4D_9631 [Trichinella pseudospiralis]|uniref:Uncharacterized protein n=1 Tax=Trichinella pseudospiralis TaxID=6337 RepID=A0A0V1F5Y7_TRIPS|nr:hypothetical protein T4D_9631 [Trichinella pseudospiralis]
MKWPYYEKRITVHHNVVSDKKHQILHEDSSIKPSKPLIIAFSFEISIFALSGDYFKIWEIKISKLWKDIKEGKDFKGVERYQSNQSMQKTCGFGEDEDNDRSMIGNLQAKSERLTRRLHGICKFA